jgi:hypothetical protein
MKQYSRWIVLVAVLCGTLMAGVASADGADLGLLLSPTSYVAGGSFTADVVVVSPAQAINAVSGVLSFPADKLEVTALIKDSSVVNLWVQEPFFSNTAGKVTFEGIILNPGFTGASGRVLRIRFHSRATGASPLGFVSGSILANDGKGTSILHEMRGVTPVIVASSAIDAPGSATTPAAASGAPRPVRISSSTHSDSEKWYSERDVSLDWLLTEGVTAIRFSYDETPTAEPIKEYSPTKEWELKDVKDGAWYAHLQQKNKFGWGGISHFRFRVDGTKPVLESAELRFEGKLGGSVPTIDVRAKDGLSGVRGYEVNVVEGGQIYHFEGDSYTLPALMPGPHILIVTVFDRAGNSDASVLNTIVASIDPPQILEFTPIIEFGDEMIIRGITPYPKNGVVVVVVSDKGFEEIRETVPASADGQFVFVAPKKLVEGKYTAKIYSTDDNGAMSDPPAQLDFYVSMSVISNYAKKIFVYLMMIIALLVALALGAITVAYLWYRIIHTKKLVKKETMQAGWIMHSFARDTLENIRAIKKKKKRVNLGDLEDIEIEVKKTDALLENEIKKIEKDVE